MAVSTSDMFSDIEEDAKITRCTTRLHSVPFKEFVPAKGADLSGRDSSNRNVKIPLLFDGSEVKRSYIQIVGSDSLERSNKVIDPHLKKISSRKSSLRNRRKVLPSNLNVNTVMRAAETNDLMKMKELINVDKDYVLNVKDQYGWNALMSACCAGSKDVVTYLLKLVCDLDVIDKKGNTCVSLAKSKGHNDIMTLINNHVSTNCIKVVPIKDSKIRCESIYCEDCKETISGDLVDSHYTSTVHMFNNSRKSGVPTSYGIPEHNVGFQMLLRTGWDKEKGLGPEGSGHKFPPKTMLKQDRTGLGAKKYVPRVTHDPKSIVKEDRREKIRTLNRRERERQELRSRRREMELRRMFD